MSDNSRFDREFLKAALQLATNVDVDHLLFIGDIPIPPADLRGRRCRKKLIYAVILEALAHDLHSKKERVLVIPAYDYSRIERVKVAMVSALSQGAFKEGDMVLCLTGRIGRHIDTMM